VLTFYIEAIASLKGKQNMGNPFSKAMSRNEEDVVTLTKALESFSEMFQRHFTAEQMAPLRKEVEKMKVVESPPS